MKVNLELEVPAEFEEAFTAFMVKNPNLWLGSQVGCTNHEFAVFIIKTKADMNGTQEELACVMEQLGQLAGLILTGARSYTSGGAQ